MLSTATAGVSLTPEEVQQLVIQPMIHGSVAGRVMRTILAGAHVRWPIVTADTTAEWVAEGAEITPSDPTVDVLVPTFGKLASLTALPSELVADSDPNMLEVVGGSIARDLARKLDAAAFGGLASPAPAGLAQQAGLATVTTATGVTAWADEDPFLEAIQDVEDLSQSLTSWVANPADVKALAKLRKFAGSTTSNEPLFNAPMPPNELYARLEVAGLPMLSCPAVPVGTIYGIAQAVAFLTIREDVAIISDSSVFFTSDRVAVRGTMRAAFGLPDPGACAKVVLSAT